LVRAAPPRRRADRVGFRLGGRDGRGRRGREPGHRTV